MALDPFDKEARDAANKLVVYRQVAKEKLFNVARHGTMYSLVTFSLGIISAFHDHGFINEKIVYVIHEIFLWVQKPMTFFSAAAFFIASSVAFHKYQKVFLPYEDKITEKGYILVQNDKKQSWLIREKDGEAEKLLDIPAYSRKNKRPKIFLIYKNHHNDTKKVYPDSNLLSKNDKTEGAYEA